MKKHLRTLLVALLIVVAVAGIAWAAMRVHDTSTAVSVFVSDVWQNTHTSNDIDIRQYQGQGKLILDAEAQGSGVALDVVVQESKLYTGATGSTTGDADLDLNLATAGTPTVACLFTQSSTTAQIKYIDLRLKKHGTIATDKTLTAYLYSGLSTTPDAILATSGTVTANNVSSTNYQWVRFTLTTPYQLSASTQYWVALDGSYAASDTNYISWHVATVASSGRVATSDVSSWTAVTTQNALFQLYEYRFATAVTFTQVGNAASFQSQGIEIDQIGGYLRSVATLSGTGAGASSLILIAPKY